MLVPDEVVHVHRSAVEIEDVDVDARVGVGTIVVVLHLIRHDESDGGHEGDRDRAADGPGSFHQVHPGVFVIVVHRLF